jgi:hypothetical protein
MKSARVLDADGLADFRGYAVAARRYCAVDVASVVVTTSRPWKWRSVVS